MLNLPKKALVTIRGLVCNMHLVMLHTRMLNIPDTEGRMNKKACFIAVLLTAFTCMIPISVYADIPAQPVGYEEPSVGMKVVDAVLVRPPMMMASLVSTAVYIAISPITFLTGIGQPMATAMVELPWRFTADRYLGDFDHYKHGYPECRFE